MKKLIFVALLLFALPAKAKVEVLDGDSLLIDGRNIRLEGIDAPEYDQTCYDAQDEPYACGQKAKEVLTALVKNGVVCQKQKIDKYKREVSLCQNGEVNLNQQMVSSGWAVAYVRYFEDFAKDEQEAKQNKRGIWQGRFQIPELYRALKREQKEAR